MLLLVVAVVVVMIWVAAEAAEVSSIVMDRLLMVLHGQLIMVHLL